MKIFDLPLWAIIGIWWIRHRVSNHPGHPLNFFLIDAQYKRDLQALNNEFRWKSSVGWRQRFLCKVVLKIQEELDACIILKVDSLNEMTK